MAGLAMNGIFEVLGENKKYIESKLHVRQHFIYSPLEIFDVMVPEPASTGPAGSMLVAESRGAHVPKEPRHGKDGPQCRRLIYRARAATARAHGPCKMTRQLELQVEAT